MVREQKGEHKAVLQAARNANYREVRFDGTLEIDEYAYPTGQDKMHGWSRLMKLPQGTNMVLESVLTLWRWI